MRLPAVMIACAGLSLAAAEAGVARPIGAYTTKGAWSFASAPGLHPPKLKTDVRTRRSRLAAGYFFVANLPNLGKTQPAGGGGEKLAGQSGPLILDDHLQPVWFKPVPVNVVAADLKLQSWQGAPALSWWEGVFNRTGETLKGRLVVVDQHYHQVATLTGKNGWVITEHEAVISGHEAWVTAYKVVRKDLSRYHGSRHGLLLDGAAQEYDLTTGNLLRSWDALAHVPLSQSHIPPSHKSGVPWDAYHVNSIQPLPGGRVLVSMRNTWGAYLVDAGTGRVVWTLGGRGSSFRSPANARFEWQHDVSLLPGNLVTVFDDACCGASASGVLDFPTRPARGLILKLDTTHRTAKLAAQYLRGKQFYVAFLGSMQLLSGGNVVVGWGSAPYFSEFDRSGHLLLDARWPSPDLSYRAFVEPWVGAPTTAPSGAVRVRAGKPTVYASWNGATQVARWQVLAGRDVGHLGVVALKGRTGFETALRLAHSSRVYEVRALDRGGAVLGTSSVFGAGR